MHPHETARRIREKLVELERMANEDGGLGPLALVLHLAILEADNALGKPPTPLDIRSVRH
ncbi:hypothetical protein MXD81_50285 [Microbacteriaceae bacterium K1510]|nr:hypothetical protein [Microbacteriaceae bacterium K1510]